MMENELLRITKYEVGFATYTDKAEAAGVTPVPRLRAVNPTMQPGTLVVCAGAAVRDGIGGHVATSLALDGFCAGASDALAESSSEAAMVLEHAFRSANAGVFEFGSKLSAGGRMSAALVGVVLVRGVLAIGRVGGGSGYLIRDQEVISFFSDEGSAVPSDPAVGQFIGAQPIVTVDIGTVQLKPGDRAFMTSTGLSPALQDTLLALVRLEMTLPQFCHELLQEGISETKPPQYGILVAAGQETLFLSKELSLTARNS
jgi:serine/threonine protein phosphatase PrpC